jgi:restriction system protein
VGFRDTCAEKKAMPIPDFQSIMLPLLRFAGDSKEHSIRETVDSLGTEFDLTDEELKELLPSGQQETFANRVNWAKTYLKKAGLIHSTRRGYFQITDRGLSDLQKNPSRIDIKFLKQYREFIDGLKPHLKQVVAEELPLEHEKETPTDTIEAAHQKLQAELASDLLDNIRQTPPSLFEKIVVELLVKMGYGGSRKDAGKAIGRSGDEGIDGIINEDKLGLDVIYIQAKRWKDTISRPEIQKFAGALQGQRAKKGIFITTSAFSREAREFTQKIDIKIILIDGEQLAQMLIEHNVGVSTVQVYEVKRLDSDYFTGE